MQSAPARARLRTVYFAAGLALATVVFLAARHSLFSNLFSSGYLAHRYCYLQKPGLIWTHVLSDAAIGGAYFAISGALIYLVHRSRAELPFHGMILAFSVFIIACGSTHFMEVATVWVPMYVLAAALKVFTAFASVVTACALPFAVPVILNLVKQARTSEATEKRFVALLESAPDAVVVVNHHNEIVIVSGQTERLFLYKREEMLGRNVEIILPKYPTSPRPLDATSVPHDVSIELGGLRKNGKEFPVEISQSPLQTDQGVLIYNAVRDITERKGAEQRLLQAEKVDSLGRLAGGIAHDFNNLLNVILGYCELLDERIDPSSPAYGEVSQISQAASRATDLTRQLLAFGRRQVLQAKVIDLNDTLHELEGMLRRLIPENVEIVLTPGKRLWSMKADPTQMVQVVMNLAINAGDAMPNGGQLHIETSNVVLDEDYARRHVPVVPGKYVLLSIKDTGLGMSQETKDRIFDPFFTTKELGKGTGLGLASVYGIVKQSGGFIWVESEPGHGTSFHLHFPCWGPHTSKQEDSPVPGRSLQGHQTVLVLEDNDQLREVVVKLLTSAGFQVLQASEPEKAIEIARSHPGPINLLLSDVVLPKSSGWVVAQRLNALRPDTKVLFVSGYTNDVVMRHGISTGAVAFLQKPYTRSALISRIQQILA